MRGGYGPGARRSGLAGGGGPPVLDRSALHVGHAGELEEARRTAFDDAGCLRCDAEHVAHLAEVAGGEAVVVDVEEVRAGAIAHDVPSPNGIRDALGHAGGLDVVLAHITVEEAG